jgi:hypothetical protein
MVNKMDIEVADAIRMDWGKYVEMTHGTLMMIFAGGIPQSLLPYPKESIREALEIMCEEFTDEGNQQAVGAIQSTMVLLDMMYIDDEVAIKKASKNFEDQKYLEAFLPKYSNCQNILLEYRQSKH